MKPYLRLAAVVGGMWLFGLVLGRTLPNAWAMSCEDVQFEIVHLRLTGIEALDGGDPAGQQERWDEEAILFPVNDGDSDVVSMAQRQVTPAGLWYDQFTFARGGCP